MAILADTGKNRTIKLEIFRVFMPMQAYIIHLLFQ